MAAGAVATDITVVEERGCPGDGAVTAATFEGSGNVVA